MAPSGWRYNAVSNTFWDDDKVRAWPEDARSLALYLLTSEHRNAEGFYRLSMATAADDLQWDVERVKAAMKDVVASGFAEYDDRARVVLVMKALKYQAPKPGRPASMQGAVSAVVAVQGSPRLFGLLLEAADKYAPAFGRALRSHYGLPPGPYGS